MKIKEILKHLNITRDVTETGNMVMCTVESENLITLATRLYTEFHLDLMLIKATDEQATNGDYKIFYVFGVTGSDQYLTLVISVDPKKLTFPSLSRYIYQANFYEAEVYSFFGLYPEGHPEIQRFILHENVSTDAFPLRKNFKWNTKLPMELGDPYVFHEVHGEGIYELPVGPVHAGIIEPGHFRFSLAGEEIVALQPKLGFVHKGTEKLFEQLSLPKMVELSEHVSGDMSFSHSLAFCQAVETLANVSVPKRAEALRVIFSELERLANHINDIGFILNDTAFAFGGSFGQRLKEKVMIVNESVTGSRFLRHVNTVGGVTVDLDEEHIHHIETELSDVLLDLTECLEIVEDNETVINRLKRTGILDKQVAVDHGVVGVAARAVGIVTDSRLDHPYAAYATFKPTIALGSTGDVYARYHVRIEEAFDSVRLIMEALEKLPKGAIVTDEKITLAKSAYVIGIAEGWRGNIVYFIGTDKEGVISRVGVRDPSFLNWPAVPYAVVGNIVPDFPLINKSFNLSYSGFDR